MQFFFSPQISCFFLLSSVPVCVPPPLFIFSSFLLCLHFSLWSLLSSVILPVKCYYPSVMCLVPFCSELRALQWTGTIQVGNEAVTLGAAVCGLSPKQSRLDSYFCQMTPAHLKVSSYSQMCVVLILSLALNSHHWLCLLWSNEYVFLLLFSV